MFADAIALEIEGPPVRSSSFACCSCSSAGCPSPDDLFGVVLGWVMLAWFGASMALLVGAGTAFSDLVDRLWHPISYLLFPMSGAAFMVDWLPKRLQELSYPLPMVHGVECFATAISAMSSGRTTTLAIWRVLFGTDTVRLARRTGGQSPSGVLMLTLEHVSKMYETRKGPFRVFENVSFDPAARTKPRNTRPKRRRKIHNDTADQRRRTAHDRPYSARHAHLMAARIHGAFATT